MSVQILPANESFQPPAWVEPNTGSIRFCSPFFFWYCGFNPTYNIDPLAGDYADWHGLVFRGTQNLFTYNDEKVAWCTDPVAPPGTSDQQRALLCKGTDAFDLSDLTYKVTFDIRKSGVSGLGPAFGGRNGSSPSGTGAFGFPQVSPNDDLNNTLQQQGGGSSSWTSGGANVSITAERNLSLWPAWRGNSLFFRAGRGFPYWNFGGSTFSSRQGFFTDTDYYGLFVYPKVNASAGEADLRIELWQVSFTNYLSATGVVRKLAIQDVPNGAQYLDVSRPYSLRLVCRNSTASPTSDVEIESYLGNMLSDTGADRGELQMFKSGVFDSTTFDIGTDVTHSASTGVVTDAHADRISTYTGRALGLSAAPDRVTNVAPYIEAASTVPINASVIEGIREIEVTDNSTSSAVYRDHFDRCIGYESIVPQTTKGVITQAVNQFGMSGPVVNGLYTFDAYADDYGTGQSQIGRLLAWTDSYDDRSIAVGLYNIRADYDRLGAFTSSATNVYRVMRQYVHQRPSSQFYNHHRSIEFKPGEEHPGFASKPSGALDNITYEFGIAARGTHTGKRCRGLVCYLSWITDADNTVTYAELVLAERNATYNTTNPSLSEFRIARRKWSTPAEVSDFNSTFDIYNGSWHTIDFRAEFYGNPTNPSSAAEYRVQLDGVEIEFTDDAMPYVSDSISPYAVIHNDPTYFNGTQEGFFFLSNATEYSLSTSPVFRNYAPIDVRNWQEGALSPEPEPDDIEPDEMASIVVGGEGTPSGYLNASPGALEIAGGGVWDVDAEVTVDISIPIRRTRFDSGHAYTGAKDSGTRRAWSVMVRVASLELCQAVQDFYNEHRASEVPFYFIVPIPSDGYEDALEPEDTETASVYFREDSLQFVLVGPGVYNLSFELEEAIV